MFINIKILNITVATFPFNQKIKSKVKLHLWVDNIEFMKFLNLNKMICATVLMFVTNAKAKMNMLNIKI